MVLISLTAPVVGLIVTITSVICELAFLTAALLMLKYFSCRQMLRNQQLKLRMHKRKVTATTLVAMLIFVALETLFSVSSDAVLQSNISVQDCVRTIDKRNVTYATGIEAEAVHFRCTNVTGVDITHHFGNYSLQNSQISCSDKVAYSFTLGKARNVTWRDGNKNCAFRSCSYLFLRDDMLYFTGRIDGPRKKGEKLLVHPTHVPGLNLTQKDVPKLGKLLKQLYERPILDEGEVRRTLLLGSSRDQCTFSTQGPQVTRVPIGVIVAAASVWAASLLFLGVSLMFRRHIFFDLGDPIHWASRARHDVTDALGNEPMVQWNDSLERLRILNYDNNKDGQGRNGNVSAVGSQHDDFH